MKSSKLSKPSKTSRRKLVQGMMMAGRNSGTHAIMFQQGVAQRLGLNATDMKCLDVITLNGPATPSQLVELTGLTSGAITILIDRLEKAGLIERKGDEGDRRRTLLMPTRKALQTVGPLYASLTKAMSACAANYTNEQLEFLTTHFGRVGEIFRTELVRLSRRLD